MRGPRSDEEGVITSTGERRFALLRKGGAARHDGYHRRSSSDRYEIILRPIRI